MPRVPTFGSDEAAVLIVGLAPGLRGANRTGRPFTGDHAGDLLYATLTEFGFAEGIYQARADDGLRLKGCAITNAVRCVPPQNKPTPQEITTCRAFLGATIETAGQLSAIVALGRIAHDSVVRAFGGKLSAFPFAPRGRTRLAAAREWAAKGWKADQAFRQLSLLSLQHEHWRFDAPNVSRCLRRIAAAA